MLIYKYLFYKFYSFSKLLQNGVITSAANAYMMTSVFITFNLAVVICIVNLIAERLVVKDFLLYFISFLPLVLVYFKSIYKGKYLLDNRLFKGESKTKSVIGAILVVAYCIISIWLFTYYGSLLRKDILKIN